MNLFKKIQTSFENYDMTVRAYLSKTFANLGMQYTHSQIFGVIFDGLKGIMQNAMFYIEDALQEQNIFTATRKKSIYSLAKVSGYEPYYGSTAVGTLIGKLQINNGLESKTTKIYIKNHTKLLNKKTGIYYILDLPTEFYVFDVTKPLVNHEFKIIQGYIENSTYVSKGHALETINIDSFDLFDKEYLSVLVNGKKWERVDNLYDMTENSEEYVFSIGYDNAFDIMFGNGVHGKKLEEGQTVTIEYLKHSGIVGNIMPDEKSEFIFAEYGTDAFGNYVNINNYISLNVSNCISGGTNSDTIEFIRNMVGRNSRSLVLATEDNFKLFFKRFSFIGNVNCWSEPNSMYVIASCTKDIKHKLKNSEDYFDLKESDILLDDNQKEMIVNTLENSKRTFAGVTLKFEDPIIRRFAIICYVKVNNVYEKDLVKSNIQKYISLYFINKIEDTQFVAKSDIMKYLLDNIKEIQSLELTILSGLKEESYKENYYSDYEFKEINGNYTFVKKHIIYEKDGTPGLDDFGNISLKSKLEIPVLLNNFRYYPNKEDGNKSSINIDAVQVYFI